MGFLTKSPETEESASNQESCANSIETGLESEAEGGFAAGVPSPEKAAAPEDDAGILSPPKDGNDDVEAVGVRAAQGSVVVWSNGYLTLSDTPAWPDVKIMAPPRWKLPEHHGAQLFSQNRISFAFRGKQA